MYNYIVLISIATPSSAQCHIWGPATSTATATPFGASSLWGPLSSPTTPMQPVHPPTPPLTTPSPPRVTGYISRISKELRMGHIVVNFGNANMDIPFAFVDTSVFHVGMQVTCELAAVNIAPAPPQQFGTRQFSARTTIPGQTPALSAPVTPIANPITSANLLTSTPQAEHMQKLSQPWTPYLGEEPAAQAIDSHMHSISAIRPPPLAGTTVREHMTGTIVRLIRDYGFVRPAGATSDKQNAYFKAPSRLALQVGDVVAYESEASRARPGSYVAMNVRKLAPELAAQVPAVLTLDDPPESPGTPISFLSEELADPLRPVATPEQAREVLHDLLVAANGRLERTRAGKQFIHHTGKTIREVTGKALAEFAATAGFVVDPYYVQLPSSESLSEPITPPSLMNFSTVTNFSNATHADAEDAYDITELPGDVLQTRATSGLFTDDDIVRLLIYLLEQRGGGQLRITELGLQWLQKVQCTFAQASGQSLYGFLKRHEFGLAGGVRDALVSAPQILQQQSFVTTEQSTFHMSQMSHPTTTVS